MPDEPTGPIEYTWLINAVDLLRVRYWHRNGVPTDFMVQLECDIDGRWVPARRYDTHVSLHVHPEPWRDGSADRRVPLPVSGAKEALTQAINDIKANRARYRAACEAAVRGEDT